MDFKQFQLHLIGIPTIDQQHWELIQSLDRIQSSIRENNVKEATDGLDYFFYLLRGHQQTEEELMDRIKYPYRDYHSRITHPETTLYIQGTSNVHKRNILNLRTVKMEMILLDHIHNMDSQITPFYNEYMREQKSGLMANY